MQKYIIYLNFFGLFDKYLYEFGTGNILNISITNFGTYIVDNILIVSSNFLVNIPESLISTTWLLKFLYKKMLILFFYNNFIQI